MNREDLFSYEFNGVLYPNYLRDGNMMQYIRPLAEKYCIGKGIDIGGGKWPFCERVVDSGNEDALNFNGEDYDFIFSSHCLEHLDKPRVALRYWLTKLRPGGVLFLYLPHPDMEYWRPGNHKGTSCDPPSPHRNIWEPHVAAAMVGFAGFRDIIYSGRDLAWSYCVVGWK